MNGEPAVSLKDKRFVVEIPLDDAESFVSGVQAAAFIAEMLTDTKARELLRRVAGEVSR